LKADLARSICRVATYPPVLFAKTNRNERDKNDKERKIVNERGEGVEKE
jgi:hypothetical protein